MLLESRWPIWESKKWEEWSLTWWYQLFQFETFISQKWWEQLLNSSKDCLLTFVWENFCDMMQCPLDIQTWTSRYILLQVFCSQHFLFQSLLFRSPLAEDNWGVPMCRDLCLIHSSWFCSLPVVRSRTAWNVKIDHEIQPIFWLDSCFEPCDCWAATQVYLVSGSRWRSQRTKHWGEKDD